MSSGPTFSAQTTADEVAAAFSDQIKGKNVLVTGTSLKGIGFETALSIARHAETVIITGYNEERLKLAEDAIKKAVPQAKVHPLILDLSSLASVRKAAAEINALPGPLHVLINNAAASFIKFKLTVDGLETQFATDHVGPFLFTKLLAPKLLAARTDTYTPRVVFVSSVGHTHKNGVEFDLLKKNPDETRYSSLEAYCQAKSMNILTAIELSKRSKGKILANSLNPGLVFTNIFEKEHSIPILHGIGVLDAAGNKNPERLSDYKTLQQGAATSVVAAFDPRLNDKPGAYLDDCVITDPAPHSSDPANAERLWNITEEIIGEKFSF